MANPRVQLLDGFPCTVACLRLDEVDPVVSGNKWYKLIGHLGVAKATGKRHIITFGGAYSNHIVATAAACAAAGLRCTGLIRGEPPASPSPTLLQAQDLGMELVFLSRADYRAKLVPASVGAASTESLLVAEGGYGPAGMVGVQALAGSIIPDRFSHILCAVGTGTTLAGFVQGAGHAARVMGLSALKNNKSLENEVRALLPVQLHQSFSLNHDFHFGGYAKHTPELLAFMNEWYRNTGIPSDFVYTGKLFYGFVQLIREGCFPPGSRVLLVHSGGLQGNRSLPAGTLCY